MYSRQFVIQKTAGFTNDDDGTTQFSARIVNWRLKVKAHAWRPPTDLIETQEQFIVRVEIAGMHVNDFVISYDGKSVVINGIRWTEFADCAFHQMEIHNGEFSSEVEISQPIDLETIEANYENGFLDVVLPKLKTPHIKVSQQKDIKCQL